MAQINSEEKMAKISPNQERTDVLLTILPVHTESAGNILNSLEVTQSIMTSEVYTFPNTSPTQPNNQTRKKCPHCAEWQAYARKSEQELVEIQNTILQKQKLLADVVSELQAQNLKQKQELIQCSHQLTEQTNQFTKLCTEKDKQISSLKNFVSQQEALIKQLESKSEKGEKKPSVKKDNKGVKDVVSEMITPCNLMKLEKSRNQRTATEWSFVKSSNKDHGEVTNDQVSCRSNWKNTNLAYDTGKDENKDNRKTQCSSRIDGLAFENENLRSYNRVLLEKLNTHKKFMKY